MPTDPASNPSPSDTASAGTTAVGASADVLDAVEQGVVVFPLRRDVVRASGPDAATFLQGQLSQDVAAMEVGDTRWSLLLMPQGKVEVMLRVTRVADDAFLLDTDGGFGTRMVEALERFRLRTKVDLKSLGWSARALRGPGAEAAATAPASGLLLPAGWTGIEGVDLLGPEVSGPEGIPTGSEADLELLRVLHGVPAMGRELTEATIPQEADVVERTVSFDKGCYVGQELVARIDSRGHVNRHLRALRIEGPAAAGDVIVADRGGEQRESGRVTSVAAHPDGSTRALGYVRREVEPPADVVVRDPAGATVPAVVLAQGQGRA